MSEGPVPAQADNTTTAAQASSILGGLATKEPVTAPPSAPPAAAAAPTGTWRDKLPEDLRGHASLGKFDAEEGLARSYVNLEKMLGGDKIPVPRSDDDQEGWDRLYKAAGRPDDPEKYVIKKPENIPDGVTYNEEDEKFLRSFAHQNGWNQKQLDSAYKTFYEREQQKAAAWQKSQADSRAEAERALQLTGNREETMTLAKATVQQYFDQDALSRLEAAGLGNDPIIIRTFAKIGKDLTGHQVLKGRGGEPVKTMEQWQNNANEYRSTHAQALNTPDHPDHKMRVAELQAMYEKMYPETAQ